MPFTINPQWQQMALYAAGLALALFVLFRIPFVGRILRTLLSFALLAFCIFVLIQQAPFDPNLSRLTARLGLDGQQVQGDEVRIRMSTDGHFWATASINGVERRMLVDSGATITALSERTAQLASVDRTAGVFPVVIRTANGAAQAETGLVERFHLGRSNANKLRVIISPALGNIDILGMNFLSQLASWRVEGKKLILVPRPHQQGRAPSEGR